MTTAPKNLLNVRTLLLDHLASGGLDRAAVGVVGDPAHRGGYHCGSDRVVTNDYSVVESSRDKKGLSDYASALDVGQFSVRSNGETHTLRTFSAWCVAQCRAGAADTADIREIIYSVDGKTVKRWDRLGRRSTGDDSHLWHTHISFFRDATKAGRDQTPLFRRYLTTIGLLKDSDMTPEEHAWLETVHKNLTVLDGRNPIGQAYTRSTMGVDHKDPKYVVPHPSLKSLGAQMAAMQAALLGAVQGLDTAAIVARIDEVANEERQRDAALLASLTDQLAAITELIRKAQSGELSAEQVLAKLRDLLPVAE